MMIRYTTEKYDSVHTESGKLNQGLNWNTHHRLVKIGNEHEAGRTVEPIHLADWHNSAVKDQEEEEEVILTVHFPEQTRQTQHNNVLLIFQLPFGQQLIKSCFVGAKRGSKGWFHGQVVSPPTLIYTLR